MEKNLIIMLILFVIILGAATIWIVDLQQTEKQVLQFNKTFEDYKDKISLGSEVATLINKAIDNNEKKQINKNDKGIYQDDGKYSVQVFVRLEKDGDLFSMERINALKITEFVKNFSLQDFKCTGIEYHKETKRVSKIYFEAIE